MYLSHSPSLKSSARHTITADADENAAWGRRGGASRPIKTTSHHLLPLHENKTTQLGQTERDIYAVFLILTHTLWKEAFCLKSIQGETTQFYAHPEFV